MWGGCHCPLPREKNLGEGASPRGTRLGSSALKPSRSVSRLCCKFGNKAHFDPDLYVSFLVVPICALCVATLG